MNKNFFKFDIDDAVDIKNKQESNQPQKTQNTINVNKKNNANHLFLINSAKKTTIKTSCVYEKNNGLESQKEINKKPYKVDDYLNFDFKAKNKKESKEIQENFELKNLSSDNEVYEIIKKAQIGVIFY